MLDELQRIFNSVTGREDLRVTGKMKLKSDLGVTSLALMTLVCAIEDRFQIEIPNTSLRRMKTVGDMVRYLEKTVGEKV